MIEIRHNGDIITYTEETRSLGNGLGFVELKITISTEKEYSESTVKDLFKSYIPVVVDHSAGDDDMKYLINDVNVIFTKQSNLNLNELINTFISYQPTILLKKSNFTSEWDTWCNENLNNIDSVLPPKDNVLQSSNRIDNYLRIVKTQFPPIDGYDNVIHHELKVDFESGKIIPLYDITYVTKSPKGNVETIEDLWDDSFPITYKQLVNRIIFFYNNYDLTVDVKFIMNGETVNMGDFTFNP